jgi:Domain of unknown function (DUF4347)
VIGGLGGEIHAGDTDMADVYARAKKEVLAGHEVLACSDKLIDTLRTEIGSCPIDVLDIYYHGGPGLMTLGRSNTPLDSAISISGLGELLAPTAHIRLLGCSTAVGSSGRMLVYKLARALGEKRVVFGTIDSVLFHHFPRGRFDCQLLLFSSLEAINGEAPKWDQRKRKKPRYSSSHKVTQRIPTAKST